LHNKEQKTVTISPKDQLGTVALGIGVEKVVLEQTSIPKAFVRAVKQSYFIAGSIFKTVGDLLGNLVFGHKQTEQLIGPVGLAKEVRNASAIGFAYLLSFTAMISINLAVINILPFPALDGGRLIIVLLERATGKKFSKKVVNIIHASGFILLITLMIVLSVGDVRRMF
jgi:regulator of sigma E protease